MTDDHGTVEFFALLDDFESSGVPQDIDTYREFRRRSIECIEARDERIDHYTLTLRSR